MQYVLFCHMYLSLLILLSLSLPASLLYIVLCHIVIIIHIYNFLNYICILLYT